MTPSIAAGPDIASAWPQAPTCFHCGLPVPASVWLQVRVLGHARSMCCTGCGTVARTIIDAGFESYYETREPPGEGGPRLEDLPRAAIYDDPLAQRRFVACAGEHGREASLVLDGIRCAACSWLIERFLRRVPGVAWVSINYATRRMQIAWDERYVALSAIVDAVRSLGYDAYPFDPGKHRGDERAEQRASLWRLFVAGFGAMQVMMYAFPRYVDDTGTLSTGADQVMRWASLALTLPVIVFACGPFYRSALAGIRAGRLGIDMPVSLGLIAGFAASAWATVAGEGEVYFDSVSMLAFLLLGSRHLELAARRKAAAGLDHLARWMPSFAFRLKGQSACEGERIAAHELRAGDRVLVEPGEAVPADGLVETGCGSTDESLLTGESHPVKKAPGAALIGGSVNIDQPLVMRVTQAGLDTQAAAIGRLIERAAAGKPRLVEAADRMAHTLTWVVLAIALATLAGWAMIDPAQAPWAAIAVLMVTCPCALGLAAPIGLTRATGALARRGVVVTRGKAIESLASMTDLVVDKTGTLTEGRLRLARVDRLGPLETADCLRIARALEAGSAHPVARALRNVPATGRSPVVVDLQHVAGNGIEARIDGVRTRIGARHFVGELAGSGTLTPPLGSGESEVFLGSESGWHFRCVLADTLRPDAFDLVNALHARGVGVHLVSGDDDAVARDVASRLGIGSFRGGVSPAGKLEYIRKLQATGRKVAVLGDGLNDAPGLAQADASIAMGQGAALAQQQADFVLLSGKLSGVLDAARIARSTMATIRQNFAWALGYNAITLPLAAFGFVGPLEAAIGMAASSFVVILNSVRRDAAIR